MDVNLDHIPLTEGLLEAEGLWAGGVADFGEREAAHIIQQMPGYFDYRGAIEDELRAQVGDEFFMWRAMTEEALEEWGNGGDMGPVGFTFYENLAKGWHNFAPFGSQTLIVVKASIRPEWVIMRGKIEEAELVVDGNQISFDTLEIL